MRIGLYSRSHARFGSAPASRRIRADFAGRNFDIAEPSWPELAKSGHQGETSTFLQQILVEGDQPAGRRRVAEMFRSAEEARGGLTAIPLPNRESQFRE
jgi:hypothetical protein